MRRLINLTPHEINLLTDEGEDYVIPSDGVARLNETRAVDEIVRVETSRGAELKINLNELLCDQVNGLPPEDGNYYYIVSRMVAEARSDRNDLLIPDEIVRDQDNKIVGCKAFAKA